MATFTQLKSGKWRAQVRKGGHYKGATFDLKRDAQMWAKQIEVQASHIIATGFQPVPERYSVGDLIESYGATIPMTGKTKIATHIMLKRELGTLPLKRFNSVHLRDFITTRLSAGAGGVTIAADLSFLGAILKWGKHSRRMDLPTHLTTDARRDLAARNVSTRSAERNREPTKTELEKLFTLWRNNKRQRIPMATLCAFAMATTMRQSEICSIRVEDVDSVKRTVIIRDRKDPRLKIGNHQTIPLLPNAWAIIEPILHQGTDGRVFPYDASSVSTAFTRACTKLGIVDLRFHDLRHKATSDLFRAGLTIPQVSLLTGHRTWTQLKRYTHTKPEDVHTAFNALRNVGQKVA
jgi:integrase